MDYIDKALNFYKVHLSKTIEHLLSLLVVFLLLSATAMWTGRLFGHDLAPSENDGNASAASAKYAQPNEAQLEALSLTPSDALLTPRDSASWNVADKQGRALGVVVNSAAYAGDVQGFAGPTPLYVYIDQSGKVAAIAAADNSETPDFFNRAFSSLVENWKGKDVQEAASAEVDAVTGATFSSKAITANVQSALAAYSQESTSASASPVIGWGKTIAVIAVLALGIGISVWFRGRKALRIVQLLLNVGVLGFWCGQFLSLSLLRGWLANSLDPVAYLPTLLMLLVAVVMPFFKRKRHYCSWVCPYGSLQELAGRLPFPKIHCSQKAYRVMARIRLGVFCVLMCVLWCGLGSFVLDYEPFTAFLVTTATPAVIVLAAAFVVASCFVPNLWCKCICPMGSALDLSEDTFIPTTDKKKKK